MYYLVFTHNESDDTVAIPKIISVNNAQCHVNETIETHARSFLALIILAIGRVMIAAMQRLKNLHRITKYSFILLTIINTLIRDFVLKIVIETCWIQEKMFRKYPNKSLDNDKQPYYLL